MRRLRILMMSPVLGEAFGQERVMRDSSRLLRDAGHEVHCLGAEILGPPFEVDGTHLVPELKGLGLTSSPRRAAGTVARVRERCQSLKPDLVHLIDQFDYRVMRAVVAEYPTVLTAHTVAPTCPNSTRQTRHPETGPCQKASGWTCLWHNKSYGCLDFLKTDLHRGIALQEYRLKREALRGARAVLAISRYVEDCLRLDGWAPEKIRHVPNPIASARDARAPSPESGAPLIVCAARLVPHKGVHALLRALAPLAPLAWELKVCGDGPERPRLEALARELGLESRVSFLGRTSYGETQRLISRSRLVAQANLGPEPFGLSVAEASALGRAVVGFDVAALNEIVSHGKTGLLAPLGDERALSQHLETLLRDGSLARAMGAQGPALIAARFSPEEHLRRTLNVYEEALGVSEKLAA